MQWVSVHFCVSIFVRAVDLLWIYELSVKINVDAWWGFDRDQDWVAKIWNIQAYYMHAYNNAHHNVLGKLELINHSLIQKSKSFLFFTRSISKRSIKGGCSCRQRLAHKESEFFRATKRCCHLSFLSLVWTVNWFALFTRCGQSP